MPALALTLVLALLAPLGATSQTTHRDGQTVHSDANPAIAVHVDPSLPFLGRTELDVRGRARAEQYFFADVQDGKLGRTVIVHFEHFLPTNEYTFGYPTFLMVTLDNHEYLHQRWPIPRFELLTLEPVKAMLAAANVTAEEGWLSNRYARVVDEAGKYELLLFYLEPASSSPVPIDLLAAEAQPNGVPPASGQWATIAAGLAERARAAFTVEDKEGQR